MQDGRKAGNSESEPGDGNSAGAGRDGQVEVRRELPDEIRQGGPEIYGAQHEVEPAHGLWVFGYGSLMWNPDFPYTRRARGICNGVHRAFCVRSIHHRGTVQKPGLVLGLDGGGSCEGVLFHVPAEAAAATVHYLRRREQINRVYREMFRRVEIMEGAENLAALAATCGGFITPRSVRALCFVAERSHPQYVNSLSVADKAQIIRQSRGNSGSNLDYLRSTLAHLEALDIKDDALRRIMVMTNCWHRR